MSDDSVPGVKISELPALVSFNAAAEFAVSVGNLTSRGTAAQLGDWLVSYLQINRPPTSQNFNPSTPDTGTQVQGNLLAGAADADGDPITIQSLTYNGTSEPFADGTFQTALGSFFLNGTTGDWVFTLGAGARALNIGDVGHEVFTYTLADGRGGLSTSTLTVSIVGTNSVPVVNYVNGQTPINTTVTGNLIAHYAFDYESALTVAHFKVAGLGTTFSAGATATMSGVGTITIAANGDYTLVPADGFIGPVPLITYTLTDVGSPANTVDAFLTLAVTPLTPGAQPVILYTDIVSGPTSGGENNLGTYLTVWVFRGGLSSALGTTTKLKIGGVEVANYRELVTDQLAARRPGLQRLTVQVGNLTGLTQGKPYPIVLTVGGLDSNANNVFTPNPGHIFFVSLSGNDSTGVIGDIAHPFRSLQKPNRGDPSVYPLLGPGDTVVIRGGDWTDIGYANCWFRFRDPQQQGSNPTGAAGTGWIAFLPYPGEDVHYTTTGAGLSGGIEGPGEAFSGTCGDWVVVSKLRMEVQGGSSGAAAPVNMQYNTGHWRILGCNLGPWVAGDSASLNAAGITGQGNFIVPALNYIHDIEGTGAQQNHGIYAGTSSYGWDIGFNWIKNCVGGSCIQFNDSDGGTGVLNTPFGVWQGFTDCKIHHNFLEVSAKYGITFSDVGAYAGDLSATIFNNVIVGTGLAPLRLNTTTLTSDVLYCFNTIYDCNRVSQPGTGNAILRNEGSQGSPGHSVKAYNNIFAFGPNTVAGTGWLADYSGQSSGYDLRRNVYFANGQSPAAPSDSLAIFGDPKFTNPATLDLSLQVSSPAINAGTQALPAGVIVNDDFTALASRLFGGAPDVGAYEVAQATPYLITPPVPSGGPQVGVVTTVPLGTWGNTPTGYSRQVKVGGTSVGSAITGTGSITYTPSAGDSGKVFSVAYTVTNGAGTTNYTLTVGTIAVGAGAPHSTGAPTISGTAQAGTTLAGSDGAWSPTWSTFLYQWNRNGVAISSATANTYLQTGADVGTTITFTVYAVDPTNGNVAATSAATSAVLPAAADPTVVQSASKTLTANTTNDLSTDSAVANNNLLVTALAGWDNAPPNFGYTDTQGHTYASWTFGTSTAYAGDNPKAGFAWLRSSASGAYTQTINPGAGGGGSALLVEVTGCDPTTVLDIPQDITTGATAAVSLTASNAATKHNDLILIAVTVRGTGHTVTPGSGWSLEKHVEGNFSGTWVFSRKLSAVETFVFTATIDSDTGWIAQSFVIKGS